MAREEVSKEISERRSRAGSNLNVNFNGGGVLLLLGAAAGALLASAFAARRICSNKRRRGSMTDGIQRDSCELSHEAKEFEGGAGDKANAGEGVVQVNSHENLDENVQISHVGQREIGFYLLEEEKGDVAEGSPTIDIELVDGGRAKLAGCRDSSANNSSSPANASRTLEICSSLGENQLKYDDDELVANSGKEDRKISCIISKEDDGDDCKGDYKEEIEGKKASSLYSEQSSILETGSSPTNVYNNLGIEISLEEDQLRYDDEQLVVNGVREETETPFIYRKEDDEDNKKAYIEEQGEKKELEEKITHINLHIEELCLFEKKTSQILDVGKSIERKFEDRFKDEMYNYILEFVLSRAKGMAASSSVGDQDEMNPLIEEIEPFFGGSGEAKVLDMTQNDSGKHTEMAIMEDQIIMESDGFKDAMRLNNLCVKRDDGNGDTSDDKMVEGSIDFCEQFATLTHKSSVTTSSELETTNSKDSITSMATEEDEVDVEESYYPSGDECVEGSIIEIQRTESCIHENPTMVMIVEEKIQLEDNATGVLTDVIQEEKIEEDLSNGFKENMKSSEAAEDLRGNEEFHLIEFQRTEFRFEQDIMMAYRDSPLIQFQGIEPIAREEKAFLEDNNLNNSEKNLEEEECQASNQELGTSDIEREDEIISVQHHELETKQYIEAHKYKLEREIEYPQTSPAVKKGVGEIHEEEDDERQSLKLFFDLAEKTINLLAKTIKQDTKIELIDVNEKHQCQVEGHENNASAKAEQQRRAIEKVKGMEHMFMGYFNGHIFLVTTLIIAFAILAFFV